MFENVLAIESNENEDIFDAMLNDYPIFDMDRKI